MIPFASFVLVAQLDRLLDGSIDAEGLARAALANRVSRRPPSDARLTQLRADPRIDLDASARTVQAADARFDYLWHRSRAIVTTIRGLVVFTLIVSAFEAAYAFYPTWHYFYGGTITAFDALARAGEWILARLAFGLGVSAALWLVSIVFDAVLEYRLASWRYTRSIVTVLITTSLTGRS